jgi:predicted nicotinamide N-methyase
VRDELAALDRRFVLGTTNVSLAGETIVLEKPRNPDDLISEAEFAHDERLPYWADLWPASVVLSDHLLTERRLLGDAPSSAASEASDAPPTRPRALELGCGIGLVTIAAMRAGYDVVATDYYEDALLFAARNAWRANGHEPETRMVDWRALPDNLGAFDLILAADVLYERPHAMLISALIARALAPEGRALIADQGRVALQDFLDALGPLGLTHRVVHQERRPIQPPAPEGSFAHHVLTVYEVRRGYSQRRTV